MGAACRGLGLRGAVRQRPRLPPGHRQRRGGAVRPGGRRAGVAHAGRTSVACCSRCTAGTQPSPGRCSGTGAFEVDVRAPGLGPVTAGARRPHRAAVERPSRPRRDHAAPSASPAPRPERHRRSAGSGSRWRDRSRCRCGCSRAWVRSRWATAGCASARTPTGSLVVERDRPCLLVDRVELDEATALLMRAGAPGQQCQRRPHRTSGADDAVDRARRRRTVLGPGPPPARAVGRCPDGAPAGRLRPGRDRRRPPGARPRGHLFDGVDQPARARLVGRGRSRPAAASSGAPGPPSPRSSAGSVSGSCDPAVYAATLRRPPRDLALFQAFGGTGTGDGAGAVCQALLEQGTGLELVWSVNDPSVPAPDGTRALIRGTPEWFEAMGSARLLVSNDTFPEFFRKSPDRTYLQMWHGTPLKRIGRDIGSSRLSTEHDLRLLLREARTWDFLVSSEPLLHAHLPAGARLRRRDPRGGQARQRRAARPACGGDPVGGPCPPRHR